MSQLILIRDYDHKTDRGFCGNAIITGLRGGNTVFDKIPDHVYYPWYCKIVDDLIDRYSKIKVACLHDDPSVNVGFSCYETDSDGMNILHWIYVKQMWQRNGIGRLLLPKNIKSYTHLTRIGNELKIKLGSEVQFEQYAL